MGMEFIGIEIWVIAAGLALIFGVIGFAVANSRSNKRRQRARERNTTFNPMDFIDSLGPEEGEGGKRNQVPDQRRGGKGANSRAANKESKGARADARTSQPIGDDSPEGAVDHDDKARQIVVLYVMARGAGEFRCSGVNRVLTRAECVLDERGVFTLKDDERQVVFSAVNALEPATFDAASMDISSTRGVAFFFETRGRGDQRRFDAMLSTARKLALEIEGELLDEKREPLSSVREAALRSDLSD